MTLVQGPLDNYILVGEDLTMALVHVVEEWLLDHDTVTSDDVYQRMSRIVPAQRSRRCIGVAFAILARQGRIFRTGCVNSLRGELHHQRISLWRKN